MNSYEQGFLDKLAEYGLDPWTAPFQMPVQKIQTKKPVAKPPAIQTPKAPAVGAAPKAPAFKPTPKAIKTPKIPSLPNPFGKAAADAYDQMMSEYLQRSRTIPANKHPDWKPVPQPKAVSQQKTRPAVSQQHVALPAQTHVAPPTWLRTAISNLRRAGNFVASTIPGNPLKK